MHCKIWTTFVSVYSTTGPIECLFLRTDFTFPSGPDIIQVIVPFFQHNHKLKFVDLEIDVQSCLASSVFESLLSTLSKCKNNQLQCLRISSTNFTDDENALLIDLLRIQQTNLLELALGDNIGRLGARALANLLNYSESKIRTLELQYHHLDVEGATILGAALVTNKTVKKLTFSEVIISHPGLAAWRGFAQCLRHPSSAIEELYFTDCIYEIECMREIVTAIAHNRSLKVLEISFYGRVEWDWTCFSTILCNAMSIESTYSSNHTLICARIGNEWLCDDEDSYRYLILNRDDDNKAAVARQKILITHFSGGGTDVHAFTRMPETAMPHAISWIGRDYQGYSLMLNFVRGFPSLFGRNNSDALNRHAGVKRKQY